MATSMALEIIIRLKMPTDRGIKENPLNKNKTTKSAKKREKREKNATLPENQNIEKSEKSEKCEPHGK